MKKLNYLAVAALLLLSPSILKAEEKKIFEISGNVTKINVEALGLPETATIYEVIWLLPEMLNRPASNQGTFIGYEVKLDGVALGDSRMAILSQLQVSDIKTVEISEECDKSYDSNGQGGSLNLIRKDAKAGFSGKVSLLATSIAEARPSVKLDYATDNLIIRGIASVSYKRPWSTPSVNSYDYFEQKSSNHTTTDNLQNATANEMARINVKYMPSDRDLLQIRLTENYTWDDSQNNWTNATATGTGKGFNQKTTDKFNIENIFNYDHTFLNNSKWTSEIKINLDPLLKNRTTLPNYNGKTDTDGLTISGNTEYKMPFHFKKWDLSVSLAFEGKSINNVYNFFLDRTTKPDTTFYGNGGSTYFSPFMKANAKFGKWELDMKASYLFYAYNIYHAGSDPVIIPNHNFTGYFSATWKVTKNHTLRLLFDRRIKRPGEGEIFPYPSYNLDEAMFYKGNPNLVPSAIHEVGIDYLADFPTEHGDFTFNLGLSYVNADNLIKKISIQETQMGQNISYTFINSGNANLLHSDWMLFYKIGWFDVSFCGKLFTNFKGKDAGYAYYNMSLLPNVHFPANWTLTVRGDYYSKVWENNTLLGDMANVGLQVSKSWGNISFSVLGNIPVIMKNQDITKTADYIQYHDYRYQLPYGGITFNYNF